MNEELLRRGAKLDRYEIRELIGQGGMGDVYRAWDPVLQRDVAMKVLRVADPDMLQRFEREAQAIGQLDSENVVQIHDFRLHGEHPFIVMEFLHGMSLRERLVKYGAMGVEEAVGVALGVCRGVFACHRLGVVHRDLKPANVFLADTAHYGTVVKVLDFGVAKPRTYAIDVTGPGKIAGTPAYVAPEIFRGLSADELSDQYGIGLLLYVALTGKPPFGNKEKKELRRAILSGELVPPTEARPDLPQGLAAALLKAMSTERAARYPSVAALGRALVPFASEEEREVSGELFEESGKLEEVDDAPTALERVPAQTEQSATAVTTAGQIAELATRMRDRSETALETASPDSASKGHVVVPVAPMEKSRPRIWEHIPHFFSSTKVDSSSVAPGQSSPTHTHVGGVIETGKRKAQRGRKLRRRPSGLVIVVAAAVLLSLTAVIALLVSAPLVGSVRIEPPDRPVVSVDESDKNAEQSDGGSVVDAEVTIPAKEKTSVGAANGGADQTGALAAVRPPSVRQTVRRPEREADGGAGMHIQGAAVEKAAPSTEPYPVEQSAGGALGRPPVTKHARRLRRADDDSKIHRQNKRRLEYTKDGSPILW